MKVPFLLPLQQARAMSWSVTSCHASSLGLRNGTRCVCWPPAQVGFIFTGLLTSQVCLGSQRKGALFFRPCYASWQDVGVLLRDSSTFIKQGGVCEGLEPVVRILNITDLHWNNSTYEFHLGSRVIWKKKVFVLKPSNLMGQRLNEGGQEARQQGRKFLNAVGTHLLCVSSQLPAFFTHSTEQSWVSLGSGGIADPDL